MSNRVGELYDLVIENVIKETKSEMEETGDDPSVLDKLKAAWRKRLMEMKVTREPMWVSPQQNQDMSANQLPGDPTRGLPGFGMQVQGGLGVPGGVPDSVTSGGVPGGLANPDAISGTDDSVLYGLPPVSNDIGPDVSQATGPHNLGGVGQRGSQHPLEPYNGAGFNPLASSRPSQSVSPPQTTSRPTQIGLSPELQGQLNNAMSNPRVPQTDGTADEELNSDLDDSEDELNSENDDEEGDQTQIMLCLYEKVHKVKTNKVKTLWKYTLKDGVANVNGLDYVFSRATGESEW